MSIEVITGEEKPHLPGHAQESLMRRLISGVSWNIVGTILAQGSVFATSILVANKLGSQSFGEFSLLQNTALTLSAVTQVATGATATRYVAQYRATDPARAGRILGFCTLLTLITGMIGLILLLVLSDWLSTATLKAPQLADGLKIMSVYLLFSAMSGYQTGALAGLEGYRHIARLGVLHAVVHVTVVAGGVWFYGLPGALWALVASLVARWLLYNRVIQRETARFGIRIAYVMEKDERLVLLRFSLPAALAGLTAMPALWLANTFLVQQYDGYRQLGLYSAAFSLKTAVMLLPNVVNSVGGSIINTCLGPKDLSRYRKAYWSNVLATSLSALLGAIFVLVFSNFLLSIFGHEFLGAHAALVILILCTIPEALALALYQIIQTREKMWWSLLAVSIPRDGLIVIAAYLLVKENGASGVAMAYCLGCIFALIMVSAKAYSIGIKPATVFDITSSTKSAAISHTTKSSN